MFVELVLRREQEEYRSEGIEWVHISYFNNEPICSMMDSSPGVSVCVWVCGCVFVVRVVYMMLVQGCSQGSSDESPYLALLFLFLASMHPLFFWVRKFM